MAQCLLVRLYLMLIAIAFCSYFIAVFLVIGAAVGRIRSLKGAQVDRLTGAAMGLGGTGAITKDGGSITLKGPDRVFELTGCDYGKRAPQTFHLGTGIRTGVKTGSGGAFRQASDARPLPRLPHAVFRKEGAVSALTKAFRLNVEIQSGDRGFDDVVYLEQDGERDGIAQMLADPELRAAVRTATETGAAVVLNEEGHGVALRWMGGTEPHDPATLNAAGQMLGAIADRLPLVEDATIQRPASQSLQRLADTAPLIAAIPGFAIGLVTHMRMGPLDSSFGLAVLVGGATAVVLALVLGWLRARGRTRALRRLYLTTALAIAILPLLTGSALAIVNGAGIEARETRETRVESTRRSNDKRGKTTCYAKLAPWRDGLTKIETTVPCGRGSIAPGTPATAQVGVGRLGWEWLASAEVH